MATAPDLGRYVIESDADSRLGELSNDFAGLIIKIATQIADERDSHGRPIITVCTIAEASQHLCNAITEGIKGGRIPSGQESEMLANLRGFCDRVTQDCAGDGEDEAPTPAE
jgi:hypothetical protein